MAIDETERKILRLLQGDGRMPNVELADHIGLSESPTFRRVKQLEKRGVLSGYAALVDQKQIGLEVIAYVQVTMERQPDNATEEFIRRVQDEPHIIECFAMSGSHDYMMKVVARNLEHFSELCMQQILKFPGVRHVESSLSLKTVKHTSRLPI